jgi:hypothetical protein
MMKPFIIAATLIACFFSIDNIADAKGVKNKTKIGARQPCENSFYSSSKYTQLAKDYPSLGNDLKDICQLINNHYSQKHRSLSTNWDTENLQKLPASGYSVVGNTEVKSIKLVKYSPNKIIGINTDASTDIEVNVREYAWANSAWKLVNTAIGTYRFNFIKTNGKWRIESDNLIVQSRQQS